MTILHQVKLGSSGPRVSRLIFGTEHIIDRSPREGGLVLAQAYRELGINHWDTAIAYKSHPQVAAGLKEVGRDKILVTSKTPARSEEEARADFNRILDELQTDYLDICFLHNVAAGRLKEHLVALKHLKEEKKAGRIHHLGISTHSASVVREAAETADLEIVCATLNYRGTHLDEGSLPEMMEALEQCHQAGKGVYVIKVLGVGALASDLRRALEFVSRNPHVDAINIGMKNIEEVRENASLLMELDEDRERRD